jgi:hypothetical protein
MREHEMGEECNTHTAENKCIKISAGEIEENREK